MKGLNQLFRNRGPQKIARFSGVKNWRGKKYLIPAILTWLLLASLLLSGSALPATGGDANGGNNSPSPGVILSAATGTNVSGIIFSNTTWTKEESPYIVVDDITVSSGVTLSIQPGVVVKFQYGKSITIAGELIARGTEAEPVTFTSALKPPLRGNWNGIIFADSSVDASYDEVGNYVGGCILEWCVVEYAGGGDNPAVRIVHSSPLISQCTIRENANSGIYIEGYSSSPKIKACTISENSGGGIYVWDGTVNIVASSICGNSASSGGGIFVWYSAVSIVASSISGNSASYGSGISVYRSTVSIEVSSISGNFGSSIFVSGGSTVSIVASSVSGNSAPYGGGICVDGGTVSIVASSIEGNSAGSGGGILVSGGSTVSIVASSISGNSADIAGGGILVVSGTVSVVHNNIISNQGSGIWLRVQPKELSY